MIYRNLRLIRIGISILFLVALSALFLDVHRSLLVVAHQLVLTQLIPSIFKVLFTGLISSVLAVSLILLLTLLFGRIYCSSLCPLGTLMDLINRARNWFKKKKRFRYLKPMNWLRYSILSLTAVALFFGIVSLATFLDPYSNFGRIITNLARPVFQLMNNQVSYIFEATGSFLLPPVKIHGYQIFSVLFSLSFLILVFSMTIYGGRLFCNMICPAGSLLSLISRYSIFRINISKEGCTRCGKCIQVCKSTCIDAKLKYIDASRCVMCFNCFESCKVKAIGIRKSAIRFKHVNTPHSANGESRRKVLSLMVLSVPIVKALKADSTRILPSGMVPIHKMYPVSPPGSVNIEQFNNRCTACHLCVTACPTDVIKPAFMEYGLSGMMQPRMAYEVYYCTYECIRCSEVCPTGAILPITLEEKKAIQIGKVNFVEQNCIVITKKKDCGACSEHCPTKAVKMVKQANKLFLPVIEQKICVGCGACEHACPTDPKSIYVDGNPVHLKAEKPVTQKVKEKVEEDFPF